jgi:adenine-specific methyltransferase EcoRI-like protein
MPAANRYLSDAKKAKKDEFYTQLSDIERELRHYKPHFKDKVVYCNCDDPRVSNFFHYFSYNFEKLGLRKLITTCYKSDDAGVFSRNDSEQAIYLEYEGDKDGNNVPDPEEIGIKPLEGDGDFRSTETIELLKQADIVVTNPPFSLFREYVGQLVEYDKKFLIIGNQNATNYKEIFPLIKNNKIWYGPSIQSGDREFGVPDSYPLTAASSRIDEDGRKYIRVKGVRWFTNLEYPQRHEDLILYKEYNPDEYPTYDNYDAIEVSATKEIPVDYDGAMGVPITFLDKHNPDQFEILGITDRDDNSGLKTRVYTQDDAPNPGDLNRRAVLREGDKYRSTYVRLLIRNRRL